MARAVALGSGAAAGLGLCAASQAMDGAAAGWLGLGAWLVPGLAVLAVGLRRGWRPVGWRWLGLVGASGLAPALIVLAATVIASGLGEARWDPAGDGLALWLEGTEAGRAALDVSDRRTLGLGQGALVLFAPIYALPLGLGVTLWAEAAPPWARPVAVGALVGGLAALGGVPPGLETSVGWLAAAGLAFGALAGALGRASPWACAAALAAVHGLPGLGPLLAVGTAGSVGWTAPLAIACASVLAVALAISTGRHPGAR